MPKENQTDNSNLLGPFCRQLINSAESARHERQKEQKRVRSVKIVPNESLTTLHGESSNFRPEEMNPHEAFYREKFEH